MRERIEAAKVAGATEEFLTEAEAAEACGRNKKTLRRWHSLGQGPPRQKLGNSNIYNIARFKAWVRECAEVAGDTK